MHAQHDDAAWSCGPTGSGLPLLGTGHVITVMLASDGRERHAIWLSWMGWEPGIQIAGGPVADADRLVQAVEHHRPDVLLLEPTMLERLDPSSLLRIQRCPRVRVLLVADEDAATAALMLRHGFQGLLPAASPTCICLKAIRAVNAGELWLSRRLMAAVLTDASWPARPVSSAGLAGPEGVPESQALTSRERQVVSRLRQGRSNKEIARELGIVEDTVKKHLKSVYAKLGVRRRAMVILRSTA